MVRKKFITMCPGQVSLSDFFKQTISGKTISNNKQPTVNRISGVANGNFIPTRALTQVARARFDQDKIYCPVCDEVLRFSDFYREERKGYNEKHSLYLRCKKCVKRSRNEKEASTLQEKSKKPRIGRVSCDPCFGLNLYQDELALAFKQLAEGKKLYEIKKNIEKKRIDKLGRYELVCRKTIKKGMRRLTPIIAQYYVDCCKPSYVDAEIFVDTLHFTRFVDYLESCDFIDAIRRGYTDYYATIAIGGYSFAWYGFGLSSTEYQSCRKCAMMVKAYTSNTLLRCKIKFDGAESIKKTFLEVGVPKRNLITVPKSICASYTNKIEGFIKTLRMQGLRKRRYSEIVDVYVGLVTKFVEWNLFTEHALRDGTQNTKVKDIIKIISPPENWLDLIRKSWKYILSNPTSFKKYYPVFNRGPRKKITRL